MIPSATRITIENVVLHPWADNPQTIGALAISQLGIYTSRKESKTPKLTEEVLRLNALESLIAALSSNDRDRREASVLALAFLSEDGTLHAAPEIASRMVELRSLPRLITLLSDEKEGMKSTALLCCRNLYLGKPEIQRQFVEAQGCQALCELLASKDNLTVFETVLNALDLMLVRRIQDENDQVQEWARNALIDAKIMVRIDEILSVRNTQRAGKYEQDTITEIVRLKQVLLPS